MVVIAAVWVAGAGCATGGVRGAAVVAPGIAIARPMATHVIATTRFLLAVAP